MGLGPAGSDLLTEAARTAIERIPVRYLRTARHPSASAVGEAHAFDDVYERAPSIDEVYAEIVDALAEAATDAATGEVLYAVPGSALVAERTVELLLGDERVDVELVPGLSFLDLAWARLGVDPVAAGVRVVDGRRFASEAAGERGPLLVAQCDSKDVLSDIKLAAGDKPPDEVLVLQRLGLPDESVRTVAWDDLDRAVEPDHLTSLYLAVGAPAVAGEVARFAELVRTLRERCPWDREQTHQTLTRHLLEETYEVLEAIESLPEGMDHLEEELGDLLFQVVFHATLAAEEGAFTLADVAAGIHDKLVHRHPHVFGAVEVETAGDVMRNWEQIKQAEKGRSSIMDGIPGDLPSLLYAHKVQRKAASAGTEVEPLSDADDDTEIGALLFGVVARARQLGVDPEAALRAATARFRDEFMEKETSDG
ncbi:MAG: putative MazG family protein [Acidimicrobiales bacterium]|nr:putative MazG family protein [Acidimicrobiales bacterium]